jgi:alpha-beta hydrolase superfamily lysophospholipase
MNLARAARPARLRVITVTVILAVAGLLAAATQAASARTGGHDALRWGGRHRPVIVLEHGAWADASSWAAVIARLQADGFTVYAPPNPLLGLPQDSAYLQDLLAHNAALAGQPVVLAGHSYGGAVITNAVGDSEVKALVYVDRAGAHITKVNAGHLSMIADPGVVARVIEQAAQATS